MIYKLEKTNPGQIKAISVESTDVIVMTPNHERFEQCDRYLNAGKLLSITERGTWSGRKDYEGYYKQQVQKDFKLKLTQLDNLHFSDDLFVPLKTGTPVDPFLSTDGGFLPGTNIMATGSPGVGKCVRHNTLIKVRNKVTGEVMELTIKEFHDMVG